MAVTKRPLVASDFTESDLKRLWARVARGDHAACWAARGLSADGYARFGMGRRGSDRRTTTVHAAVYALTRGPVFAGMLIRHSCDRPSCCNPSHLIGGSEQDNHDDAVLRGRVATGDRHSSRTHPECMARGSRNGATKLTEGKVRKIRDRRRSGLSLSAVAAEFNVSQSAIRKACNRDTWRSVR